MRLIDADALREHMVYDEIVGQYVPLFFIDRAPSIACAADNPHGLVPSKCPMCGETLVPYPCIDLAQDSYRDGILYGQEHPEWRADG